MGMCSSQPAPSERLATTKDKVTRSQFSAHCVALVHSSPSTQRSNSKPLSSNPPTRRPTTGNAYQDLADATPLLSGKVAVVTGSTGGPLLVASTLVRKGAYVILVSTSTTDRSSRMQIIEAMMEDAVRDYRRDQAGATNVRPAGTESPDGGDARGEPAEWLCQRSLDTFHTANTTGGSTPSARSAGTSAADTASDATPPRPWGTSSHIPAAEAAAAAAARPPSPSPSPSPFGQRRGVGQFGIAAVFGGKTRALRSSMAAEEDEGDAVHAVHARTSSLTEQRAKAPRKALTRVRAASPAGDHAAHRGGTGPLGGGGESSVAEAGEPPAPWPNDGFSVVDSNFQDLQSVRAGALEVLKILEEDLGGCGVDLLVNIADDRPRTETSKRFSNDGFDVQVQATVLSHFLLTRLLMPALQIAASARGTARIVNCTSGGHPALSSTITADCFSRSTKPARGAGGELGNAAVAACAGGVPQGQPSNAYGVLPHAPADGGGKRGARGATRLYRNCRDRYLQSRKASLVLGLALRDLLGFSRSTIAVTVAITGSRADLDPPQPNADLDDSRHAGHYAIAARHSTMERWMPVLACACLDDLQSGDIYASGPDRSAEPCSQMTSAIGSAEPDVGWPEKITLKDLGISIEKGVTGMVWEGCQKAVSPFLPGQARK